MWVILTLVSAFSLAASDALTKKAVRDSSEYLVAFFRLLFTLPLLLIVFPFVEIPRLDETFFRAFIIALPIELVTIILYVKALKVSPMSLTLPFLAITPVFLIVNSYLIAGERVSLAGGAGILLIAAGGYLLNIGTVRKGILEPVRAIGKEKGTLFMICVAFLYSFTASLGKVALEHSSPLFFGITYFIALTLAFAPYGLWMGRGDLRAFIAGKKHLSMVLPGFFFAVMIATHMLAMKLTKVAYMVSVKRSSLLMGVLFGYFFFQESNIRERFLGAVIMFAGFVLVVNAR